VKQKNILIIDDEKFFIEPVAMILRRYGYEVSFASDGMDGLQRARNDNPDLILLDLMLPSINGYQLCTLLKFDDQFKDIPIIIASAKDTDNVRDLVERSGADFMLTKPIDLELLLQKVELFIHSKDDDNKISSDKEDILK
jgi:DNA-binding response OmpR family regulator